MLFAGLHYLGGSPAVGAVSYEAERDGVRIKATRYSVLKKYKSPLQLLVKPGQSGAWPIVEELSESRVARQLGGFWRLRGSGFCVAPISDYPGRGA